MAQSIHRNISFQTDPLLYGILKETVFIEETAPGQHHAGRRSADSPPGRMPQAGKERKKKT